MTGAAVVGNRVTVGLVTLVNAAAQIVLAVVLGRWLGLTGIALAGLLAACLTSIPAGAFLLRRYIGLSPRRLVGDRIGPWASRTLPIAALALLVSIYRDWLGFWGTGMATGVLVLAYAWHLRPLYGAVLALDPRWTRWLAMVRLVPPHAPGVPLVNQS
jgi:hypothetical protein